MSSSGGTDTGSSTGRPTRARSGKPVRQPRNTGGKNIVGQFASVKMQRSVPFESLIERDLLYLADFAEDVVAIEAQPFVIEYTDEAGRPRRYTPDFLLGYADRDLVVECKPATQVGKPANLAKWEYARRWCAECDWQFVVVTDEQLRRGYRLENVKLLTQFARHPVLPQVRQCVHSALSRHAPDEPPLTMGELAEAVAPSEPASAFHTLLTLAYLHKIDVSLDDAPLSSETFVWLPSHPPTAIPRPPLFPSLTTHGPFALADTSTILSAKRPSDIHPPL
ncbi:MAG TPA: TnsA endonuclease N-terminal domain-containing protein [Chloroflexia bacterium]